MAVVSCSRQPPAPEPAPPPSREARSSEPSARALATGSPDSASDPSGETAEALPVHAATHQRRSDGAALHASGGPPSPDPAPPSAGRSRGRPSRRAPRVSGGPVARSLQRRKPGARAPHDLARAVPGWAQGRGPPDRRAADDVQGGGEHGPRLLGTATRARRRPASTSSSSRTSPASSLRLGHAVRGRDDLPRQGKRLCTQQEWNLACSADPAGKTSDLRLRRRARPDHLQHEQARTRSGPDGKSGSATSATPRRAWNTCATETEPLGAFPRCRSRLGVFDQHGNVAEMMTRAEDGEITTRSSRGARSSTSTSRAKAGQGAAAPRARDVPRPRAATTRAGTSRSSARRCTSTTTSAFAAVMTSRPRPRRALRRPGRCPPAAPSPR